MDNDAAAPKIRVMIVDDHELVRSGLENILRLFDDIELVAQVDGGEKAVGLFGQAKPDVVLMDLIMPGMSGVTAIEALLREHPGARVLALTSFSDEDLIEGALRAGAIGYLLKNITGTQLVDAIRAAYSGRSTLAPEAAEALIHAVWEAGAIRDVSGTSSTGTPPGAIRDPHARQRSSGVTDQFSVGPSAERTVTYRLDDTDRAIITCLLEDARMSNAAVARAVGVPSRTVGYRISKLTRLGVIEIGAVVDPHSLGLDVVADVFMEVAPGRVREVAERFARLEQVSYVAGSIGNGDLSIQVCLDDSAVLGRFVEEIVAKVPGVIRARRVLVPWNLMDVHQWNIPPSPVVQDEVRPTTRG